MISDHLLGIMQEMAAEVVQRLEPAEASTILIEVWMNNEKLEFNFLKLFSKSQEK